MWTVSRVSTLLIIPNIEYANVAHPNIEYANMAHPNMEDAHVAPLNRPDGEFPNKNIIMKFPKIPGWPVSGRRSTKINIWDWDPDPTGSRSSKKGFPDQKRTKKTKKMVPPLGPISLLRPYMGL